MISSKNQFYVIIYTDEIKNNIKVYCRDESIHCTKMVDVTNSANTFLTIDPKYFSYKVYEKNFTLSNPRKIYQKFFIDVYDRAGDRKFNETVYLTYYMSVNNESVIGCEKERFNATVSWISCTIQSLTEINDLKIPETFEKECTHKLIDEETYYKFNRIDCQIYQKNLDCTTQRLQVSYNLISGMIESHPKTSEINHTTDCTYVKFAKCKATDNYDREFICEIESVKNGLSLSCSNSKVDCQITQKIIYTFRNLIHWEANVSLSRKQNAVVKAEESLTIQITADIDGVNRKSEFNFQAEVKLREEEIPKNKCSRTIDQNVELADSFECNIVSLWDLAFDEVNSKGCKISVTNNSGVAHVGYARQYSLNLKVEFLPNIYKGNDCEYQACTQSATLNGDGCIFVLLKIDQKIKTAYLPKIEFPKPIMLENTIEDLYKLTEDRKEKSKEYASHSKIDNIQSKDKRQPEDSKDKDQKVATNPNKKSKNLANVGSTVGSVLAGIVIISVAIFIYIKRRTNFIHDKKRVGFPNSSLWGSTERII